jgi:hypothetical protein
MSLIDDVNCEISYAQMYDVLNDDVHNKRLTATNDNV